ncbi:MFS general substrate transporter [Meira miltonrushii]|uniref:MFS general substrate transporter n=1 Tax=Meira miltonrushii TaxID=1280837 RepID=A0A316VAV9_9BASI|nr:MFS general substrate transporter [Meira miltonrushii]PWN32675.1 MFS general substrate transporter [Meira miltonrushii]
MSSAVQTQTASAPVPVPSVTAANTIETASISHHSEDEKADNDVESHHSEKGDSTEKDPNPPPGPSMDPDLQSPVILNRRQFLPLYLGMLMSVIIVSLDNTIVATAQVPIVTDLGGASLITWLPATFLIGQCSFTLMFGQLLTIFPSKMVYLFAIFLFELGSVVSGVAPNMAAMLSGRTISGIGAAGIFMGMVQVLVESTTLAGRAIYMGLLGAVFSISMVAGPLIGGALSDSVTWRWCFYVNLPVGAVAVAAVLFLFPMRPALGQSKTKRLSVFKRLLQLDWIGVILLTGIVCMVIVPMQEAQNNGWASATTLVPICMALVVLGVTGAWFWYREQSDSMGTMLPLKLFADVNFLGCCLGSFLVFWITINEIYLIPLFYETVLGHSALKSGVDMLALVITFGVGAVVGGVLSKKTGHYYPQFLLFPLIGIVASGLLYTIKIDSSTGYHVGTQILLGVALGPMIQSPMLALQANCPDKRLISRALSFCAFAQRFGGGIGSSITGAMLAGQLPGQIRKQLVAINVDPTPYEHLSYDALRSQPQGPIREALLRGLTGTIDLISIVALPLFAVLFFTALFLIKIRNINTEKQVMKKDLIRKVLCMSKRKEDSQA